VIRYDLICGCGHPFDAWFGSSADYDAQAEAGLVECPLCGGAEVRKQAMAPAVARPPRAGSGRDFADLARVVRRHIADNFDNVGPRFAEQARQMHDGEREPRPIFGEATRREAQALRDDGVPAAPLPRAFAPDADKKLN